MIFFTKYWKNPRKLKIVLLLTIVTLIVITLLVLNNGLQHVNNERLIDEKFVAQAFISDEGGSSNSRQQTQQENADIVILKSPKTNGIIQPEKYDEHKVKTRLIQERIEDIKHQSKQQPAEPGDEHRILDVVTNFIHIYYAAPVQWYKTRKPTASVVVKELLGDSPTNTSQAKSVPKILNTPFYPAMGIYKPTVAIMEKHFDNIRNCGIGAIILSYSGKPSEMELYQKILQLVPKFNLTVTFEISVANNQSLEYIQQQLKDLRKFYHSPGFLKIFSISRKSFNPVIYISNAYKLMDTVSSHAFCKAPGSLRYMFDGFFIGHIRLKNHADFARRLCLDGFYSKLPSNGATFSSTWKNWSYLKTFAATYKLLFVPTVGPGYAERNKFPRHGDIQRHRSNGRYYGVAWRTAILNHIGFINVASYNYWPDGSQIEEVTPKAGFLDYSPGTKTKYLDLTTHWVGNFIKTRNEAAVAANSANSNLSCYEYLNNTIC